MWWSRIVDKHPLLIIVTVLAINWVLISISLLSHSLPSFEDPLIGFEVRGTQIAERTNAWKLLLESTSWNGVLSLSPKMQYSNHSFREVQNQKSTQVSDDEELKHIEDMESKAFRSRSHPLNKTERFCGKIFEEYIQFVVTSVDENDLFSLKSIKILCQIDRELLRLETSYEKHLLAEKCETESSGQCCQSWSLHNYVTLLSNKTSCEDIDENDIIAAKRHFEFCAPFYHNFQLNEECLSEPTLCRKAPKECFRSENAVFNGMHYLVDWNYLNPKTQNQTHVKYTNIFLPIAKSTKLLEYFYHLSANDLQIEDIKVVAMDLGLKYTLFDEYLLRDTILLIIAFFIVLLSLFLYTTSIIVTLVTVLTIVTSLGSAYFCYTIVFNMPFFPFMNLLAIVIAIGIGSDNALIYCKVWECAKSDKTSVTFLTLVRTTLSHVWVSAFAASATTCLAFFAGYFSDITSIKCFSVFASTSVLANFVLTMLTLPSAVIMAEKASFRYFSFNMFWKFHSFMTSKLKIFFEKILFEALLKCRYFIVLLFGLISVLSVIVVVYRPQLQLPDSQEFQIFSSDHYFEKYDFEYKNQFWFNRIKHKNDDYLYYLPIRVVFGVKSEDNGDRLNPLSRGSLQLDPGFDVSSKTSQKWLIRFCRELRNQSFYKPTIGPLLSNCFIETLKDSIEDIECLDPINGFDRTPCCRSSRFPYKPSVFNMCLNKLIDSLDKTPNYYLPLDWAGPRFDKKSMQMVAAVVEYDSIYSFSHSFVEMRKFWNEVNDWITIQMRSAPKELQNGWFISSQMDFYALQLSLSEGTIKSIIFAVFFSFVALVATTWNLRLSALSTLTISTIIFSTIAVLIGLNWKLNVLESISISLAIGLAIDFTLHYTIAYKLSTQLESRENGIHYALARIASPVAMAALTTALAGLLMLLSSILAYIQIGTFLIVLSFISWFYSTVFHLSLLSIFGSDNTTPKTDHLLYCCLICKESTNTTNSTLRSSTLESTTSDSIPNAKRSIKNGSLLQTLSISSISSSSQTNGSFQFQNQTECHELEKMIK